jgi:hypothetical protein
MRPRLTYANVVSSLALFLVLTGGAAYALDGSNTVFTDDIVNGEVKVADIGQGAVTTDEIANGQVKAGDVGDGEVKTAEIANGQVLSADVGDENLTGAEIASNSLKGADIDESTLSSIGGGGPAGGDLTGTYPNPQIRSNAVGAAEVIDGSLNDEDLGFSLVAFEVNIGTVPAHLCIETPVSGIGIAGDHQVLTPELVSQHSQLIYSAQFRGDDQMSIQVCNVQGFAIDDETTKFNLLAIDAQ